MSARRTSITPSVSFGAEEIGETSSPSTPAHLRRGSVWDQSFAAGVGEESSGARLDAHHLQDAQRMVSVALQSLGAMGVMTLGVEKQAGGLAKRAERMFTRSSTMSNYVSAETAEKLVVQDLHDTVTAVAFSTRSTGVFAAATVSGMIRVYDAKTGVPMASHKTRGCVSALAFVQPQSENPVISENELLVFSTFGGRLECLQLVTADAHLAMTFHLGQRKDMASIAAWAVAASIGRRASTSGVQPFEGYSWW